MENKNDKNLTCFTLLWGTLYLAAGLFQVMKGAGFLPYNFISANMLPSEIAGGLVLVVIGAVYLYGTFEFSKGSFEGRAYAYVGVILSLLFGVLYFLTFVADLINARVLLADGFEQWTPLSGFKPALYLGLLSLTVYTGWKEKFGLQE